MAEIDYALLRNDAETAIADNGRDITLIKSNRTASDLAMPWRGAVDLPLETEGVVIKAVFQPVSGSRLTRRTETEEIVHKIADSDEFLLASQAVEALDFDPHEYDLVQDGDSIWRILSIHEEKPGPVSILFYLRVGR